jgi:hypothetical protein
MIGIDSNTWLVYEGVSSYGHGVWPTPITLQAGILEASDDWKALPTSRDIRAAKLIFREDTFDPVTGLRRGRLYQRLSGTSQPSEWYLHCHPAIPEDEGSRDTQGRFKRYLLTYYDFYDLGAKVRASNSEVIIVLGASDAITLWTIVQVETVASGQEMLTLKIRSNLGVLPEVDFSKVPKNSEKAVRTALEKLRTSAYREQAGSLIEQCRSMAQIIISHWFEDLSGQPCKADDLGGLHKKLENSELAKDKHILLNTSKTLALFHNRNKPNVRERLGDAARDITESDGAFSLQAIALLLHEVGWTKS